MPRACYSAVILAAVAHASKYKGDGANVRDDHDMPLTETLLTYDFEQSKNTVETKTKTELLLVEGESIANYPQLRSMSCVKAFDASP